jgi:hypothetical protein
MAASVNVVYNTLKDLVNKDQQGFVTVDEFNRFAQVAQLRIFNRLFDTLKDGSRLERAGFGQGRDKSKFKQINEDLAIFAKTDKDVDKVFPESINKIQIRYYKIPQSFLPSGSRSSDPPTFNLTDASAHRDFELPEHYTMDLVMEIASLIGVNLRDIEVSNYAQTESTERKTEQSF